MNTVDLILGRTGSGKSRKIADRIAALIDGGYGKCVHIVVPDQYTMTCERFYIDVLGDRRFSQVRVSSVKRLCRHVLSACGELSSDHLTQGGKTALCAKALKAAGVSFKYYPADYFNMDFVKHLAKTFSSFKVAGIGSAALLQTAELESNDRLADIARIYMQYEMLLSEGLFDPDDDYAKLCECLEVHDFFAGEYVFVDNFRTFTPREREVIKAIASGSAHVTVAIPAEDIVPDDGLSLHSFISDNARRLTGLLKRAGIGFKVEKITGNPRFDNNGALAFAEEHIFRDGAAAYYGRPQGISLCRCLDPRDEVEAVASEIVRLVSEEGYGYSDINVTARSMDSYSAQLYPVFETYGIPFFHHKKTPLLHKTPVALIDALISMASEGYTRSNTVAMIKTGFLDLSAEDEHLFEAYVRTWNVKGKKYLSPFVYSVSGFSDSDGKKDEEKLARINAVREYIVNITSPFAENCSGKTVKELSEMLYAFIRSLNLEEKLTAVAEDYKSMREESLYSEQVQVYGMLVDAMDDLCSVVGNDAVELSEYRDLLMSAIDAGDIGIIPTSIDEVMTGSVDKVPFMSPKCVFVMGMSDGVFPGEIARDPIVSDADSLTLEKHGMDFGMTAEQRLMYERFLSYTAFTAASERLYITFAQSSGARVSPYVEELKSVFPDLKEEVSPYLSGSGFESRIRSEKSAFSVMTRVGSPMLREIFESREGYSDILRYRPAGSERLSDDVSRQLFGNRMKLSSSRVDRYYKCKFSYFCKYGMSLSESREAKIGSLESGNFIHAALEELMPDLSSVKDDGELWLRVQEFGNGFVSRLFSGEEPSASFSGYFSQLLKKVYRLLLLFRREWLNSDFKPVSFELKIDEDGKAAPIEVPLERGSVILTGKVDRVDTYEKDGKTYIRVVDYKSGKKTFDLQKVYNGIDVQMLMYLHSLTSQGAFGADSLPAGVMYVNVNPSIVSVKRSEGLTEAEKKLRDTRKRSGLILNDADLIFAMDRSEEKEFLPNLKNTKNLATTEEFGKLFSHIEKLLARMGNELRAGRIERGPALLPGEKEDESCKYCAFAPYCNHDGCAGNYDYGCDSAYGKTSGDGEGDKDV